MLQRLSFVIEGKVRFGFNQEAKERLAPSGPKLASQEALQQPGFRLPHTPSGASLRINTDFFQL